MCELYTSTVQSTALMNQLSISGCGGGFIWLFQTPPLYPGVFIFLTPPLLGYMQLWFCDIWDRVVEVPLALVVLWVVEENCQHVFHGYV